MEPSLKQVSKVTLIFLAPYIFVYLYIFINPNILDSSNEEFEVVKNQCNTVNIGMEVELVMNQAREEGLSPLLLPDFLEIKKNDCSCRMEYKNNTITKKYIAACHVDQ